MKNKFNIKILLFLTLSFTYINAQVNLPSTFNKINTTKKAKEITLPSSLDKIIKLSDYKGKTVILNFWATWCPPCKLEMPYLQSFYEKVKDKDVVVLAVSVGQDEDDVFPFVSELKEKITFPILYDKSLFISTIWGIEAMPTTFIINKKGFITHYALGARNFNSKEFISMVLNNK